MSVTHFLHANPWLIAWMEENLIALPVRRIAGTAWIVDL
jgi:hypothetical protein